MPVLAVVGFAVTGERDELAFRVGDRENAGSLSLRVKAIRTGVIHHAHHALSDSPRGVMNHARTNDPISPISPRRT